MTLADTSSARTLALVIERTFLAEASEMAVLAAETLEKRL